MCNSLWPLGDSPWNSPGQNTGVGSLSLLWGIYATQGLNPDLPHCRQSLYQLSHKGSARTLEWVAYPFSSRSSRPRNQTGVSWIADGFLTNWANREARILERAATPSSRGSSQPWDGTQVSHIAGRFFTDWDTREVQETVMGYKRFLYLLLFLCYFYFLLKDLAFSFHLQWRRWMVYNSPHLRACPFHYRGLECKSRKSRNTWSNRQIWPWNTEWSRAKSNRV